MRETGGSNSGSDQQQGGCERASDPVQPKKIVIAGVCGSGKSALADGLRSAGYEAQSVAQEHSLVPDLFLHHHPDLVIYLDASDETVAARKKTGWEPHLLAGQRRRLKLARQRADIFLSTDGLSTAELLARAEAMIRNCF